MNVEEQRRNYESLLDKIFAILVGASDVDDSTKQEVRRSVASGELSCYLRHPDTNDLDSMPNEDIDDNIDDYIDHNQAKFISELSSHLWNGDSLECIFNSHTLLTPIDLLTAIDLMVSERVKTIEDFLFAVEQMSKIALSHSDKQNDIKPLLYFLTDVNILLGRYENALRFCPYINDKNNRLINIKLLANYPIDGYDIVQLVSRSEFNLTEYEHQRLLSTCREYINYLLSGLKLLGCDINQVLQNAALGNERNSFLDYMPNTVTFLKEHNIKLNLYDINGYYEPLYAIIKLLYTDMKSIGIQSRDVSNIVRDWEDEIKLYFQLKKIFPKENIVHNYSTPWLWKFKIAIYFPSLNLAFDYRGAQVMNSENYSGGLAGQREYLRLYDRTIAKATSIYGMHVIRIGVDTPFVKVVECVNEALAQ